MSCVFNLGDVFELIEDRFDNGSFTQQAFVGDRPALIFHVGWQLGTPRKAKARSLIDGEPMAPQRLGKSHRQGKTIQPNSSRGLLDG